MSMTAGNIAGVPSARSSRNDPAGELTVGGEAPARRIKVMLVEDHLLFRSQLAALISRDPRILISGESDHAAEALEMVRKGQPDLAIVDITLKGANGLDLIKELKAVAPKLIVLVLSMHDESMYAERALRAGASGYITKCNTFAQLRLAMDRVLDGGIFLSARMTTEMLRKLAIGAPEPVASGVETLSPRELEIFRLIGKGLSTREIATELQLGEKTVHSHRFQIKAKLGIRHSAELYSLAARWAEDQSAAG
jgi:DNA-binding NarL/FixJ family response regulator